jgi:hypothetical protein
MDYNIIESIKKYEILYYKSNYEYLLDNNKSYSLHSLNLNNKEKLQCYTNLNFSMLNLNSKSFNITTFPILKSLDLSNSIGVDHFIKKLFSREFSESFSEPLTLCELNLKYSDFTLETIKYLLTYIENTKYIVNVNKNIFKIFISKPLKDFFEQLKETFKNSIYELSFNLESINVKISKKNYYKIAIYNDDFLESNHMLTDSAVNIYFYN